MLTTQSHRYRSRTVVLALFIALLLFSAKVGSLGNQVLATTEPTAPAVRARIGAMAPQDALPLATKPTATVNFIADAWTKVTAQPGDMGALLNVTISNVSSGFTIYSVTESLQLDSKDGPISCLQSSTMGEAATSYVNAPLNPGGIGTATFALDVLPNDDGAPCQSPQVVNDTVSWVNLAGTHSHAVLAVPITVSIPAPLTILGSRWVSPSLGAGGYQGDQGDTLILDLQNPNPFPVSNLGGNLSGSSLSSVLSNPVGADNTITANHVTQEVVQPSGTGTLNFTVDVTSNATLGSTMLTADMTYDDQWSLALNSSASFSVDILGRGEPNLVTNSSILNVGTASHVSFDIIDSGNASIYSPSFTIQVAPPLEVVANSTFSSPNGVIHPASANGSAWPIETTLALGLTAQAGSYPGTVVFSYLDSFGVHYTETFSVTYRVNGTTQTLVTVTNLNNAISLGSAAYVAFEINNVGTGAMYTPSISLQVASPLVIVSGATTASSVAIPPAGSMNITSLVSTGPQTRPGAYPGAITVTYLDQFEVSHTLTFSVGFSVGPATLTSARVTTVATTLVVGATSNVTFQMTNIGTQSLYSPTFTLVVPAPLEITANSTYTSNSTLLPGNSTVFEAQITVGPKTPITAYPGTLEVSYTDELGEIHVQNFTVGLLVVGVVHLVLLDQQIVQHLNNLTVSGTLLNDGTASALYGNITLAVVDRGSGASPAGVYDYIGTINPTTPIPFSLSVPYGSSDPGSGVLLNFGVTYQDNYRQSSQFNKTIPFTLVPLAQLPESTMTAHQTTTRDEALGGVAAVVVIAIGGALFIMRRRPSIAP